MCAPAINYMKNLKLAIICSFVFFITASVILFIQINRDEGIMYETVEAEKGNITKTVLASGILTPSQFVKVGAQVDGQIKKIYVTEGQNVKKGQLLIEIDPTLQQNEVSKAQAQLENARSNIELSNINVKRARLELKRQKGLDFDGAGVKKDFDDAKFALEESEIGLKTNKMQIIQAAMDLESAKAKLNYTRIVAPIDGEVLGIIASEGQTIVSSQNSPTLIVLANLDIMKVNISINEVDVRKIVVGQDVYFNSTSDIKNTYSSKVKFVQKATSDFLNSDTQTSSDNQNKTSAYYAAGFEIENKNHSLLPSMTVDAHIVTDMRENVLRIPNSLLNRPIGSDRYVISIQGENGIENREIVAGLTDGIYSEVVKGLSEGEIAIISEHKVSK